MTRVLAIVGVLAMSAVVAATAPYGADYAADAGPAIRALLQGDLGEFFAFQPLMGSFSLLLRAPFAALAGADASDPTLYRLGVFPCVAAAGLAALYAARERTLPIKAGLVYACAASPVALAALQWGHPEELLGGALCAAAVVAALRERTAAAVVLLALAVATKQWALIAAPVVFVALPKPARLKATVGATAAALILTAPLAIGDPERFEGVLRMAANADSPRLLEMNVWWPLGETEHRVVTIGPGETATVANYTLNATLAKISHPLIVLLALPLTALWRRRRAKLPPESLLALLALLFLLRCLLDPVNNEYYHVPFLVALASWEALARRGLPVLTVLATAALWLVFRRVATPDGDLLNWAAYMTATLPLAAVLAGCAYAPGTVSALGRRLRISQPVPVTATRSSIRTPNAPLT
ncbi:MAG: hypothetical protein WD844_14370 [Thermoleophilaceae bacterium]